ncbi:hypothetical protein Hanom_Chr01g00026221 [Helianthus anomalus]
MQTPKERAAMNATPDAEHEAGLNAYLAAEPKKKSSKKPKKKQSNKQMILKDPTKRPDKYVIELGSSHYDKVGNKSAVASWRYDHDKTMWLITRESGHREYYAKESQFQSWTNIDLKSLLRAPYQDSDLSQRGRGWMFHSKLEKEVKKKFPTMKTTES